MITVSFWLPAEGVAAFADRLRWLEVGRRAKATIEADTSYVRLEADTLATLAEVIAAVADHRVAAGPQRPVILPAFGWVNKSPPPD